MASPKPLGVMGCPCVALRSVEEASAYVEAVIAEDQSNFSVAINAEKVLKYRADPEFKKLVDASHLPVPDGSGAVIGLRWLHGARSIKLDLPRTVLELANRRRIPLFLLGAKEEVNAAAYAAIGVRYPQIPLVGRRNGYFSDEEEVVAAIAAQQPRVVLVAMGSPKQEIFSFRAAQKTRGILFVGAGGALDVLAGRVSRAPRFMVENHLEWLYRLVREPSRIRRQVRLPLFFLALVAEKLRSWWST